VTYVKADLPDKWHSKLKHYRDETSCNDINDAVISLLRRGILAYESDHGELPDEYDKTDHPTWDHRDQ